MPAIEIPITCQVLPNGEAQLRDGLGLDEHEPGAQEEEDGVAEVRALAREVAG
jgi:hypothetical protein